MDLESKGPSTPTPPHRTAVGGMWEEIGRLQFDFVVSAGLRPDHTLLDIGCGSLRGGRHFIPYLQSGHYWGVDKDAELLRAGLELELEPGTVEEKQPTLVEMDDFGFERLGRTFDFALAQSLFTHLPLNSIMRCIVSAGKVLAADGRFYATFFENTAGKQSLEPLSHERGGAITYYDSDPFHYDLETIRCITQGMGLGVEYLGEWRHPRDQKMLLFTRR